MTKLVATFVTIVTVFCLYQNCSPSHIVKSSGVLANDSLSPVSYTSDLNLENQALAVLQNKCASCHQNTFLGGVGPILDVSYLLSSGLIIPGNPAMGRLTNSIREGSMPRSGSPVTPTELNVLENWITSIIVTGEIAAPMDPLPVGKTVSVDPALHTQALRVLNINCAGCHQNTTNGGIGQILDVNFLVKNRHIVPGSPNEGRVIGAIEDNSMPMGRGARVTAADLLILKNWINALQIVDDVGQPPLPTRESLSPTFTSINANIIQPLCIGCHGPVRAADGRRFDSYDLVSRNANTILSVCSSREMPEAPYPSLNAAQLSTLRTWIQNGTPNN